MTDYDEDDRPDEIGDDIHQENIESDRAEESEHLSSIDIDGVGDHDWAFECEDPGPYTTEMLEEDIGNISKMFPGKGPRAVPDQQDNVRPLHGKYGNGSLEERVDAILDECKGSGLEEVIILGISRTDGVFFRSSQTRPADVLFLVTAGQQIVTKHMFSDVSAPSVVDDDDDGGDNDSA